MKNWLPSVSASISKFYPQIFIWRLLIGIDSFPRYFIAFIYFKNYISRAEHVKHGYIYHGIIRLAFFFHIIELTSLLLLSYVSSVEIFSVHKLSFIAFLSSSVIYMILTIISHFFPKQSNPGYKIVGDRVSTIKTDQSEHKYFRSRQSKILILLIYILCLIGALYCYIRHNLQCEPNVYSLFALFEYLAVLSNIAYHTIIFYDMDLLAKDYKISMLEEICKLNYD